MRATWLTAFAACWAFGGLNPGAAAAEGWHPARIDALVREIPALLQEYDVPGVAIALTSGPRVQWSAGFGWTGWPGVAVTPRTVFQVASLGKPVFAHLVDSVAAERDWELGDPVHLWSPGVANPRGRGALAAEELLSHTSGLWYDAARDQVVLETAMRGKWRYSGAGYALLQRALEAAEGRSLEELSESILFAPLGLRTMSYVAPKGEEHAVGHDRQGNALAALDSDTANAASSLYASAQDYAQFLVVASGLDGGDARAWMRLTQVQATVEQTLGMYWGIGWAVERDPDGHHTAFHWGSNPGFKSFALLDPERRLGLVILTNGDHGLELAQRVVGILDPKPHPLFEFYMLHPDD